MTATRLPAAVRDLLRDATADADLVARFVGTRDEAAFAELVRRHGGPVWDVCRAVLRNAADADDAFQATFLTLARRASALREPAAVGAWLHGVAVRVARKARAAAVRREQREAALARPPAGGADPSWCEVRAVVHEELAALPERYRGPLVACYLRGLTHDDTAAELGLTKAAVKKRLERGRDRLRAALGRRGLGPALMLAVTAAPAPARLIDSVTRYATCAAPVPPAVLPLVEGGVSMTFAKFAAALVVAGVCLVVAAQDRPLRTPNAGPPPTGTSDNPSPGAKPPAPAPKGELEGTWTVTLIETGGRPVNTAPAPDESAPTTTTFVFAGGRCEVKGLRVLHLTDFRVTTDAAAKPKQIDATMLDGPKKGETFPGIYATDGDTLRICLRLQRPELGRPKGYVTNSGTTLYTFVLTRSKAAGEARPELTFDDVLRSGNKLYLVLDGKLSKSFPDDLAPFAERLDLAVKTADRVTEKDLTVVLVRRFERKAHDGMMTGFTREQLRRYAAEEPARRIDKLTEHAWTVGRLPKDATPLPPEPPQPKAAPPKEVSIYDRVHTTADLPVPGTRVTSGTDRRRVYDVTNTLRMWGDPRNAGKHPGLYGSADGGKTWKLVNTSYEFKTVFAHPATGDLFAVIEHAWSAKDDATGTLTRYHADKAVRSTDGGSKWADITPPPGYIADISRFFADPDHPGRACFVANVVRDVIYRPKDDRYTEYDHIRAASAEGERLMARGRAVGEGR